MGKVDRDKYDFEGFDDKQIAMAFKGGEFGDEDYARLTGKPMGGLDNDPNPDPNPDPKPDPDPSPTEPVTTTPTEPGSDPVDNSTQGPGAGVWLI